MKVERVVAYVALRPSFEHLSNHSSGFDSTIVD
jgi:hypothetical protein